MKILRTNWHGLAWAAVIGMCLPPTVVVGSEGHSAPARPSAPTTSVHDVALAPGGLLVGQILDQSMQPVAGAVVEIHVQGQTAAVTRTDEAGIFAVSGLRGGFHQVVTQESIENCRLWSPDTAPPHAADSLRLVPGQAEVVRGQWGSPHGDGFMHTAKSWATNPWVIGGVIATAIAVPIILHNIDKKPGSP